VLEKLVAISDVVVVNLLPKTAGKLGVDPVSLKRIKLI